MTTTPAFIPSNFFKQIEDETIKQGAFTLQALAKAIWVAFQPYLPIAIVLFFIVLAWAFVMALLGKWSHLGKILYRVFLFIALGITIAVKGWEIVFNPYFDLICLSAYLFSYNLTGIILKPFKRQ